MDFPEIIPIKQENDGVAKITMKIYQRSASA